MKKTTKTGPDKLREYNILGKAKYDFNSDEIIKTDFIEACKVKKEFDADLRNTIIFTIGLFIIMAILVFYIVDCKIKLNSEIVTLSKMEIVATSRSASALSVSKQISIIPTPIVYKWQEVKATAYCACVECCGKTDGITRSGAKAKEDVTIAADWSIYPAGTKLFIEGIGERIVQDTGSKIKGNRIDIYMAKHSDALKFGRQKLKVRVVE